MPTAAKIEKLPTTSSAELSNGKGKNVPPATNGNGNGTSWNALMQEPQKIANSIIEKKVRNLEKRKVRLLEIKALEDKGQQLEADQKNAVKKLDNVSEMIDMLKEIGKNVVDSLNEFAKQVKKQQKKELQDKQAERQQQELERSKLWVNSQFFLSRISMAKKDLLSGENGAPKLEENKVDGLEKLSVTLIPQNFDSIEPSIEKINNLLDGSKREFVSGVSYSDLKETLVKLIDSNYLANIPEPSDNSISSESIPDAEVKPAVDVAPPTTTPTPAMNVIPSTIEETKTNEESNDGAPVHHLNPQLCFMRDTIVENELQHKDPAVVAVASSGFTYQPQLSQALTTSVGSNIAASGTMSNHYSTPVYPAVTIPSITFTNQSYTPLIPGTAPYMPVTLPTTMHQMSIPEQTLNMRNIHNTAGPGETIQPSDNSTADSTPVAKTEQLSTEIQKDVSIAKTSQDVDAKPSSNVHFESNGHVKRSRGGGPRGGGPRGNGSYRGRGGKNYFNGNIPGSNGQQAGNFNPNRPPVNRSNGGPARSGPTGPYRHQNGGFPRNPNHFNNNHNQPPTVSAK